MDSIYTSPFQPKLCLCTEAQLQDGAGTNYYTMTKLCRPRWGYKGWSWLAGDPCLTMDMARATDEGFRLIDLGFMILSKGMGLIRMEHALTSSERLSTTVWSQQ